MSKHTPGPWYAVEYCGFFEIQDEEDYQGTIITDLEKCPDAEANARLMASAPELLQALQDCLNAMNNGCEPEPTTSIAWSKIIEAAELIIKKAT